MVLTDRQREDLHAGIYEYLQSRGDSFAAVAEAFAAADPTSAAKKPNNVGSTPLLEKKWTAIPRLQKKVLELERTVAQNAKIHAHRSGSADANGGTQRRMLPRLPCSHTLQGHAGPVTCVQVHPVYTIVASGSEDGAIKLWDHESGEYMKTLKGHTDSVNSLAFTPAGNYLASCSNDLSIKIWDFATYNCIRTLRGHDHTISNVRFIPNNNVIPSTDDQTAMDVAAAMTSKLLSASRDHTVKLWDMETGFCDQTFTNHSEWVRTLAVRQNDGALWASAGNDQVIFVYDTPTQTKIAELRGHEHVIEDLSFIVEECFPKLSSAASASTTAKHKDTVRDYLASAARDRSVRLWSIATASCIAVYTAHENWVKSVVIHPSGNYVISAGDDRTIRVFDIKANRCLRTLENAHGHFVSSLDMHHTLPILVSGGTDQVLKTWLLD